MARIDTSEDLAKLIQKTCQPDLTPRPWDFNRPHACHWWLVPGTEWPAFRHGKIICSTMSQSPRSRLGSETSTLRADRFFVGINIEKGYGKEALEVVPALKKRPDHFLTAQWPWTRLVTPAGAARFETALNATTVRDEPVHLYVKASYVHERDRQQDFDEDILVYSCTKAGLSRLAGNNLPLDVLTKVSAETTFGALAAMLGLVGGYFWVDLYVGTYVSGVRPVEEAYRSFLSHFSAWVVPTA